MTAATGKNNTTFPFGLLKNGLIYRDDVSSFPKTSHPSANEGQSRNPVSCC